MPENRRVLKVVSRVEKNVTGLAALCIDLLRDESVRAQTDGDVPYSAAHGQLIRAYMANIKRIRPSVQWPPLNGYRTHDATALLETVQDIFPHRFNLGNFISDALLLNIIITLSTKYPEKINILSLVALGYISRDRKTINKIGLKLWFNSTFTKEEINNDKNLARLNKYLTINIFF